MTPPRSTAGAKKTRARTASPAGSGRTRAVAAAAPEATDDAPRPYHHGDLPKALLAAAEAVLVRDGIAGLGLRAIAREAGVSHTAPKHHFGDTRGLLSELAAVGYRRLEAAMQAALAAVPEGGERGNAVGGAYVRFARDNPALFGLMFRNEIIDMRYQPLLTAARGAMRFLVATGAGAAASPESVPAKLDLPGEQVIRIAAAWAYVHGLATLLIDQRLRGLLAATAAFDSPNALVDAVLDGVRLDIAIAPARRGKTR